jgi:hypothetical protein
MTSRNSLTALLRPSNGLNANPKIKVLVCTANMGNEAPNVESISEWIPNDGDTKAVLQNQRYPVRASSTEKKLTSNALCETLEDVCLAETPNKIEENNDGNNGVDNEDENFHIIAIGMQEATFESSKTRVNSKVIQRIQQVTTAVEQVTKDQNNNKERKFNFKKWASELASKKDEYFPSSTDRNGHFEPKKEDHDYDKSQGDTHLLHQILSDRLPSYTRAVSYQRGQMRLMIFYKKDKISLNVLGVKAQNTGKAGLANKGGIVAECDINSGTRISFLTAHLEAHEGLSKYKTRCSTISDIFRGTVSNLANSYCDVSMTSHFTFAMGDLNFRTRLPHYEIGSDEHLKAAHIVAEKEDWDTLNEHDELILALRNKECLVGFLTPRCDFPPTFKVERKDGYSYISKRSPSYTDRILYKANHNMSQMITLQSYGPIDHFTTSDHKPIRGAYEIQLNNRLKSRPILTRKCEEIRIIGSSSSFMRDVKIVGLRKSTVYLSAKVKARNNILHFSFSSIGCEIFQDLLSNSSYTPSPYVTFIPTPGDAIETEDTGTTWKTCWRNNEAMAPLTMKWPQTQAISNTLHPQWENEINLKIRSHFKWGTPVDLTGAMLHILVHDAKDNSNLIGSCCLNLASLIFDAQAKKNISEKSVSSEQSKAKHRTSMAAFVTSLLNTNKRKSTSEVNQSSESTPFAKEADARRPFKTNHVKLGDEILMKNGKEVGSIKFDIDTLWLS